MKDKTSQKTPKEAKTPVSKVAAEPTDDGPSTSAKSSSKKRKHGDGHGTDGLEGSQAAVQPAQEQAAPAGTESSDQPVKKHKPNPRLRKKLKMVADAELTPEEQVRPTSRVGRGCVRLLL